MDIVQNTRIQALSLLTSVGCNLNCSYCHIAQSVNEATPELIHATIQALQDGTYLKNVLNVLRKLHQAPSNITDIALWGQEPTLTIQYLTDHITDWLNSFPYWKRLMFSTNGMEYGERIIDLFQAIDNNINYDFFFDIQCSFDGNEGTDKLRKANSEQIFKNLSNIFNKLQQISFQHIIINFNFHGVLSLDLLKSLNTNEKLRDYYLNLQDWATSLSNINYNNHVFIQDFVDLTPETPLNASTSDGLLISDFIKRSFALNLPECPAKTKALNSLLRQYSRCFDIVKDLKCSSIHQVLEKFVQSDDKEFKDLNKFISKLLYCGNGYSELKIMYDGTLANCQNHIYETDSKFIKNDSSIANATKKSLAEHHYFINPLTDDYLTIIKYFELFHSAKEESFLLEFSHVLTLMYWLLQANQIDNSYQNFDKMLEHAFLLTIIHACSYNYYIQTGSMFVKDTGLIRFFCNGFMDEIFNRG